MTTAISQAPDATRDDDLARLWWIPLVTGSLYLVFALLVFQFDETSVTAISILLGVFCLAAAVTELVLVPTAHGGRRLWHLVLAAAFVVIAVVAFVHPNDSFKVLSTLFAFFLLLRGIFDLVVALLAHGLPLWWVGLITGSAQILLAFWAAGNFGHKAFLIIVWVGATALAQGVVQIVRAFQLKPG
ncbi:MAG TPA: DUF308 domain-containing protein [Gaiellaceae bacterium]